MVRELSTTEFYDRLCFETIQRIFIRYVIGMIVLNLDIQSFLLKEIHFFCKKERTRKAKRQTTLYLTYSLVGREGEVAGLYLFYT